MVINQLMLGVCNACQIHCEHCAHSGIRQEEPRYQMPLDDLEALFHRLKVTNSQVDTLMFNGPGEPLLWEHFNQAIRLIRSRCSAKIKVTTNGLRLSSIATDVWDALTQVCISTYGQVINYALTDSYANKITYSAGEQFLAIVPGSLPVIPSYALCGCYGPLYYKRHVFPHCGPPVFGAAKQENMDAFAYAIPLHLWNPDTMNEDVPKHVLPCAWCWANGAVPKINVDNTIKK